MASTHVQGKSTNVASRVTLILALLLTCPCWAAIAVVNTAVGDSGSTSVGSLATAAKSVTAGNTLVVLVRLGGSGNTVSSIADTALNTFTHPAGCTISDGVGGQELELWYAKNVTGNASDVVTVTFASSTQFDGVISVQLSGASATAPFDVCQTATSGAGQTTVTSGSFTPAGSGEFALALGGQTVGAGTWTAGTGYSLLVNSGGATDIESESRAIPTGAQTASITYSAASGMAIVVGAFVASGGGATHGLFQPSGLNGITTGGQFFANPITFSGIWAAIPAFFWRKRFAWNPLIRLAICPRSKLDSLVTAWLVRAELGTSTHRQIPLGRLIPQAIKVSGGLS